MQDDSVLISEGLTADSTWQDVTVTVRLGRLVVETLWTNASAMVGAEATHLNVTQDVTVTITTDPVPFELILTLQDAISSLQGNLTDLQGQVNTNLYIGIGGGSIIGLVIRVAAVLVLRKKS